MSYFKHESAVVDDGAIVGAGSRVWHWTHVSKGSVIGENCVLGQNVYIGSRAVIGSGVKIQNNVSIYDDVIIEDDVFCGPSMVFTNVNNPRAFIERKDEYRKTIVRKGASLGANCTVVCGVEVGEYAFVGAGCVVTKDVKPYALIVGVPGNQIGWVSRAGERLDETLICPRDGSKYRLNVVGDLELVG